MNLAKISANGQITVPIEIRRLLNLKSGDKIQTEKLLSITPLHRPFTKHSRLFGASLNSWTYRTRMTYRR